MASSKSKSNSSLVSSPRISNLILSYCFIIHLASTGCLIPTRATNLLRMILSCSQPPSTIVVCLYRIYHLVVPSRLCYTASNQHLHPCLLPHHCPSYQTLSSKVEESGIIDFLTMNATFYLWSYEESNLFQILCSSSTEIILTSTYLLPLLSLHKPFPLHRLLRLKIPYYMKKRLYVYYLQKKFHSLSQVTAKPTNKSLQ